MRWLTAAALAPMYPTALMAAGFSDLNHLNGPLGAPPVTRGMAEYTLGSGNIDGLRTWATIGTLLASIAGCSALSSNE